jgi:hypothetical protein
LRRVNALYFIFFANGPLSDSSQHGYKGLSSSVRLTSRLSQSRMMQKRLLRNVAGERWACVSRLGVRVQQKSGAVLVGVKGVAK